MALLLRCRSNLWKDFRHLGHSCSGFDVAFCFEGILVVARDRYLS